MKILITSVLEHFKITVTGDGGGQDKRGEGRVSLVKLSCFIPVSP